MTDDRQTVTIRLKPQLHEFLRKKMMEDGDIATKQNFIGTLIRPFLQIRPSDVMPQFPMGDDCITIKLPDFDDLRTRDGTIYMSEDNQKHFEAILDKHFKEIFYNYVDDKVRYLAKTTTNHGAIKKTIMQFCSDYGLYFDKASYEMLKQSYYRRRKEIRKKSPFFLRNLSLSCPLFFLI